MASRVVDQQQARGMAVAGVGVKPQKKNAVADGRNRKPLGEIGNQQLVRGIEIKPNRPITSDCRNFRAQLLANAQAAAANENNKKQVCVNVNELVAVKRDEAPKPVQKKVVNIKLKPKEIIEISPDTEEGLIEKVHEKKKEGASKKKAAPTLTSVLTARSKAACGLTNKPKEVIVDIDAKDAGNDLAAVEYVEDMYKFYKLVENENRPHDYLDSQAEINENMRAILMDWLVVVHSKFELSPETFYLTTNIIDRFLSVKTVPRRELQLVGISAMLIASKYEEIWPPQVDDFVSLSDNAYSNVQILVMEKMILGKLEWTLTVPTLYVFLVRFIKAAISDEQMENLVYFLAELGMMHYGMLMYCPSMVAASAVYAAKCTLNKSPAWCDTLKLHTGFSESQLIDCSKVLVSLHAKAAKNKLQGVFKKYLSSERGAVALLSPAKVLLPPAKASGGSS
ncbi:G2/mitotic-specific cyclin S13-7 isoform X1 [Rosa chinensis]|uniref:G2/mitotic-specific cyclin S13-7 isoform X1 n=1 Tax=Rosa chinensis TaxID=74649 RepID=UPI000D08ED8B|nr:G2/mitotic-specific cyclin S13-7 isoform X1 [Rosa chinensis]